MLTATLGEVLEQDGLFPPGHHLYVVRDGVPGEPFRRCENGDARLEHEHLYWPNVTIWNLRKTRSCGRMTVHKRRTDIRGAAWPRSCGCEEVVCLFCKTERFTTEKETALVRQTLARRLSTSHGRRGTC